MRLLLNKIIVLWICVFTFLAATVYLSCTGDRKAEEQKQLSGYSADARFLSDEVFAGEKTCKSCHEQEYTKWQESHHFRAMEKADSSSVLGNFNNTTFTSKDGMKSTFYKKHGKFFVNTEGGDGGYYDYEVIYTFGYTPLQQYIVEYPKGRFQCLSTAWDTKENKWFDLYPGMKVVHSEWLHQSKGAMTWNTMCANCHSTNVRKNFHEASDSFNTQYSNITVSCEACHGPGKEHVESMTKNPSEDVSDHGLQMTKSLTPKEHVDECARCHSRREQITLAYNHEGTYYDHYFPQVLTEGLYYADGQILDEVYVYGSFLQSKMYMNNVKCTDCHNAHSMELKMVGNTLCGQCHEPKKYDTELHTFHQKDTEGSQCINCHMTGKFYMVNDFRRDHSFRIPRPDLTVKHGTPNACNSCHEDKTAQWAWENYKEWYGDIDSLYYTDILASGRAGDPSASEQLIQLSRNEKQPPIVRATAVTYLGRYADEQSIQSIISLFADKDPLVRGSSIDALGQLNLDQKMANYLLPMLKDEKRAVRVKAFKALAALPEQNIPLRYREIYDNAEIEFKDYLSSIADFPAGQLTKAIYFEKKNQPVAAIKAYKKTIEMDSYNNMARNNLANLYYHNQQLEEAEKLFHEIIEQEPEYGHAYYSLGLLKAEMGDFEEAIAVLKSAAKLLPENTRVRYNLGLIYQNLKQYDNAVLTFKEGLAINSRDESLLYALFYFYTSIKRDPATAREYLDQLLLNFPENNNYRQIDAQLRGQ